MGRKVVRKKDDKMLIIHLDEKRTIKGLKKLVKKNGKKELKPYMENIIETHVEEAVKNGTIKL